jgi:parallel beta-helix repeat protein
MMKGRIRKTMTIASIIILMQTTFVFLVQSETIQQTNDNSLIIVDKNGNGQYISIQEAIDNAASGSTIYIKNGEYPEIIQIKKTIWLIGEDKDSTLINPISEENRYAVYIGAPNIKIKNIGITNGAPGIYSQGIKISSKNTEIDNCKIFNTPVGIAVWTSENKIYNSTFYGCKDEGIALLGSSKNPVNNNIISNCIFYDNCDGIELQYSSYNQIINCKFYNNTHTGINAIVSNNNENIISNCEIFNNRVHGIYLSSSNDNKIIDSTLTNNIDGNIVMNKYSTDNEIIENPKIDENKRYISRFNLVIQNLLEKINNIKNLNLFSF